MPSNRPLAEPDEVPAACRTITVHHELGCDAEQPLFQLVSSVAMGAGARWAESGRCTQCADKPEVTLRDLIRVMRSAHVRLTPTEKDARGRQYRYLVRNGVQEGDLVTYADDGSRWLRLDGRDGWTVDMKNPTPAEILVAAELCGWDIRGRS